MQASSNRSNEPSTKDPTQSKATTSSEVTVCDISVSSKRMSHTGSSMNSATVASHDCATSIPVTLASFDGRFIEEPSLTGSISYAACHLRHQTQPPLVSGITNPLLLLQLQDGNNITNNTNHERNYNHEQRRPLVQQRPVFMARLWWTDVDIQSGQQRHRESQMERQREILQGRRRRT